MFALRIHGTVGVMTLKDAIVFVLLCPVLLTGCVGAVWIYFKGWEDFTRTISACISFGFLMGVVTVSFFYIMNRVSLRTMKRDGRSSSVKKEHGERVHKPRNTVNERSLICQLHSFILPIPDLARAKIKDCWL
ncbi:MAG: hypothetical protein WBV70_04360 [Candidatus Bathyarchaeia archaeon]